MCVIIVKEKNGSLPKKESLENCFNTNGDGAGFMYVEDGKVVIDKGYMNFKSFYKHYKKLCNKFDNFEGKNLVMHMRISTAGGVQRENTHPFPLTDNLMQMKKTYLRSDVGVVHNGIISAAKPTKTQEENAINDTMIFIKEYLKPIYDNWHECFTNTAFMQGVSILSGSKFAILDSNDNLYIVGDFTRYEDSLYSNSSYMTYKNYYRDYNYDYGFYEDYWKDYLKNKEKKAKKEKEKENQKDYYKCDSNDYVYLFDYCDEEIPIYELQTEEGSEFWFDVRMGVLLEFKDGKTINEYDNAWVYDAIS